MLAPIVSYVSLPHYFRQSYSDRPHNLGDTGDSHLAFTDVDIELIQRGELQTNHLAFHKERWYEQPGHICFTIYEVETNYVVAELHVLSAKKRVYWKKPLPRFTFPDMMVMLKITQDPNVHQIYSTSIYQ